MAYQGATIGAGVPPYAVALAERGRAGRLVIYAGAGLSRAEPAGLPSGAEVAERIYHRLHEAFPEIAGCDPRDLPAVADAVVALPNGEEALRLTAVRVAEFTTATPTYGHRVLALLLLEGVLDVLTTNWDNCVERGGGSERVSSIVTEQDLLDVAPKSVLKVHGCATRPASLLVTTQHLERPPTWVSEQTGARLGTSLVVFVGIGDIAGYVRNRLEEAISQVADMDNIRVVGPSINDPWTGSPWAQLVPSLREDHRIAASSDEFLDKLGAAYVLVTLGDVSSSFREEPALSAHFEAAFAGLKHHDALTVLVWVRNAAVVGEAGRSVLAATETATALMALGKLAGADFRIGRDSVIRAPNGSFEVLVAIGPQPASRLRREARIRLERHLGNGLEEPQFVIAGGIGWPPEGQTLGDDILGGGSTGDVLDGPLNVTPDIVRAEVVVSA